MGKIIVSENVTLDGVVQDPTGDEGFRHGGWFGEYGGKDLEEWGKVEYEEAMSAEAMLLGRRSDEFFAGIWLTRTGAWADRLNAMPKYVVSATLAEPRWSSSTGFKGAVLSGDLVDEVRLSVFPVVLGDGERLFGAFGDKKPMRLTKVMTIGDGLAHLTYERTPPA